MALDPSLWVDLGQRRAVGLGDLSSRSMGLVQRGMVLDAVRLLSPRSELVAPGTRRRVRVREQRVLVSAAVSLRILQLQLALLLVQSAASQARKLPTGRRTGRGESQPEPDSGRCACGDPDPWRSRQAEFTAA